MKKRSLAAVFFLLLFYKPAVANDKMCRTFADPLKVMIGETLFEIPGYLNSQTELNDGYTAIEKSPKQEDIPDLKNPGKILHGYCQEPDDPVFRVGHISIKNSIWNIVPYAQKPINIDGKELSIRLLNIHKAGLKQIDPSYCAETKNLEEYRPCADGSSYLCRRSETAYLRYDPSLKILGEPVILSCAPPSEENDCMFYHRTSLDTYIQYMVPFKINFTKPERLQRLVSEMNLLLKGIIPQTHLSQYPLSCPSIELGR